MLKNNEIIQKYLQADFEHRLSLFLEYPSYRKSFIGIDQGENDRKWASQQKTKKIFFGRIWKKNRKRAWLRG